jgi:hypothetical protein
VLQRCSARQAPIATKAIPRTAPESCL